MERIARLFQVAMRPLPLEKEKQAALKNIKANVEFVSVPLEALIHPESISDADAKAYVADTSHEATLRDYFDRHKSDYSSPEKAKARHILIRASVDDPESEKTARSKIEDLAAKAKTGDFAKLASQFSEDPNSKTKGGIVEFTRTAGMVPEVAEAAFNLQPNEISEPIKSDYGFHLIQMVEKIPAVEKPYEEVKENLAAKVLAAERSRQAVAKLQELMSKNDEAAVRKFISDHNLKWEESGAFSVDSEMIPKIGPNPEAAQVAFNLTPAAPMATTLVRQGPTGFVLRHKPVPAEKPDGKAEAPDFMAEIMARRRGEEIMNMWTTHLAKDAKIHISPDASVPQ